MNNNQLMKKIKDLSEEKVVFNFLTLLRSYLTEEQFKDILAATDQDIKFNRVMFGKTTKPLEYIKICTRCANVVLKVSELA